MEYANADNTWPEGALDTIQEYRLDLEQRIGKKIGDAEDPLLVSVRSGAPMSMPGMMDTVLNLGLNDQSVNGLIAADREPALRVGLLPPLHPDVLQRRHGPRRRPVRERHHRQEARSRRDERHRAHRRGPAGARGRVQADLLRERLCRGVPESGRGRRGAVPPGSRCAADSSPSRPCSAAGTTRAPRSTASRTRSPTTWAPPSTCRPWCSATRATPPPPACAFTRNPANGEQEFYGDYLVNAQGEDVVAGIRNTEPHRRAQARGRPRGGRPRARRGVRHPGEPLPRHVRHRVHHRAGQAVDAPDPRGQAHRRRRAAHRHRAWWRRASSPRKRPCMPRRPRAARPAAAPAVRQERRLRRAGPRPERQPRAPPWARPCSPPPTP